ncbi:hypothetical protein GSF70_00260 [Flavobacteriaceae bacterium W22]|nr:hypothetical protein [Flavobacteriaceae bacterium W22]
MENGPDFHTYTFSVIRDNTAANAPVENILMTPNTDGSYRVFHIVLNLTEADKSKIANGEFVDYKNKQQVTELAGISNLSSLSQRTSCTLEYYSYPVPCIGSEKHLPGEAGCPYTGDNRAYWATGVFWNCQYVPERVDHIIALQEGGGGGGGGGLGAEGQQPPDDCTSIATDPTQVGLVSPTGCNIGVPTEPIVRPSQIPCEKTKALLADPVVQTKIDSLEGQSKLGGEKAFLYMNNNTTSALIAGGEHHVKLSQYTDYKGIYHNHTPLGTKMLSVNDIVTLYKNIVYDQTPATAKDTFVGMVAHETCNCPPDNFVYHNYLLRFNGDLSTAGAIATMSAEKIKKIEDKYWALESELLGIPSLRNGSGLSASLNAQGLERLFFGILAKMNIATNQITLQKIEKDGTINTIQLNPDGTTTPVPCP